MKRVTIDFSECKYYLELYYTIKDKLGLSKECGNNLDALWDYLTGGYVDCCEICLKGMDKVPKTLQSELKEIIEIFKKAEADECGDIKLVL